METLIIDFLLSLPFLPPLAAVPPNLSGPDRTEECCSRRTLKDRLDSSGLLLPSFHTSCFGFCHPCDVCRFYLFWTEEISLPCYWAPVQSVFFYSKRGELAYLTGCLCASTGWSGVLVLVAPALPELWLLPRLTASAGVNEAELIVSLHGSQQLCEFPRDITTTARPAACIFHQPRCFSLLSFCVCASVCLCVVVWVCGCLGVWVFVVSTSHWVLQGVIELQSVVI